LDDDELEFEDEELELDDDDFEMILLSCYLFFL
jgi:hypothetical protein